MKHFFHTYSMSNRVIILLCIAAVALIISCTPSPSDAKDGTGILVISDTLGTRLSHLAPGESQINNQIWSVEESQSGWVFFAEEEGILALRGDEFVLVKTPNASTVRSLKVTQNKNSERLYYGEQGDFGFVDVDSTGILDAKSLKYLIPDSLSIGNVWNVLESAGRVYFQTRDYLLEYDGKKIKLWESEYGFHNAFEVSGRIFIREFAVGLIELVDGELRPVLGGEMLSNIIISGIVTDSIGTICIWTHANGVYEINKTDDTVRLRRNYPAELQSISDEFRMYHVARLDASRLVVATLGAGLIIVDNNSTVINHLSLQTGFPDNSQNYLKVSRNGGLWVALDNEGVAYLDNDLVRLTYDRDEGISGYINDIKQIDKRIYVTTGAGIFASKNMNMVDPSSELYYSKDSNMPDFVQISEQPIVWSLEKYHDELFIASESGIFRGYVDSIDLELVPCEIPNDEGKFLAVQAFSFAVDSKNDVLIVGLEDGLAIYDPLMENDSCQLQRLDLGLASFEIRSIELQDGKLFLGTAYDGFVVVSGYDSETGDVDKIMVSSHHPLGRNDVVRWGDSLFGVNANAIFRVELSEDGENLELNDLDFSDLRDVSVLSPSSNGVGWLVTTDRLIQLHKKHSGMEISGTPESMKFEKSSTSSILVDSTGVVWFNNGSELIRYDPRYDVPGNKVFNAHIAQVTQNSTGKVLFHGVYRADNGGIALTQPDWSIPVLSYEEKNLSFGFSATEFISPESVQYRYRLVGADND